MLLNLGIVKDYVGYSGFQVEYERKFLVMCFEKVRMVLRWFKSSQMYKIKNLFYNFILYGLIYSVLFCLIMICYIEMLESVYRS